MGKRTLNIVLDSPASAYLPGQQISGRVILETSEDLKVRGKFIICFTFTCILQRSLFLKLVWCIVPTYNLSVYLHSDLGNAE